MNISNILIAAGVLGGLGLIFGLVLGIASKVFEVHKDERLAKIMEVLPCANCGGCGFAGCGSFAQAVIDGKAPVSSCSVGGAACAEKVSDIMGVESSFVRKTARVKCVATCNESPARYNYSGTTSCKAANRLGGGPKSCSYGCMGFGSCVSVCEFDAMHIVDGIAVVDMESCTACGKCVEACPKGLIEIVPENNKYFVACNSKDKGSDMKNTCSVGCIACKLCVKACEYDAIEVKDNLAVIDTVKCTSCGACFEKCPRKIIKEF